ncbi:MAG: hypothetical protein SD837_20395 [Candidatus Electrothrix scaldis]|nr:MAG: hypothetical protein SD837_20395 [Candidatus Electrothrix sp. GW3-3]
MLSVESPRKIIGVPRKIAVLQEQKGLQWNTHPEGGHTSTFIFTSSGAAALRIGISADNLPSQAELRFFQGNIVGDRAEFVVTGEGINTLIQRNMKSKPDNEYSDVYWSPVIEGESLGVEIYVPPGGETDDVQITFSALSHLAVSPFSSSEHQFINQDYGDSNACQNDATCYPSWLNMRKAVAKMVFTDSGSTYICTGTLLNDADLTTWKPYFISANHCIANQTVASTLQTLWFFESSTCNGTTRNADYATRTGGATLLWTGGTTTSDLDSNQDASLLELHDSPPAGVYYAGWNINIDPGELTGVHHPQGDWKKISFGNNEGEYKCYMDGADFSCTPSDTGSFLAVDWTDGGTQGGSSGSGIFHNSDELVGVLKGGNGGCDAEGFSVYSKFSAAYSAGNLGQWLNTVPSSGGEGSIVPILYLLLNQ